MRENSGSRRRRSLRGQRVPGGLSQRPWKQVEYRHAPINLVSADELEAIHNTALTILEEIGFKVLTPEARAAYAAAGFKVDEG